MKYCLPLVTALLLCSARPGQGQSCSLADAERAAPQINPGPQLTAGRLAGYADRLRLQPRQRRLVRACVGRQVDQLAVLEWQLAQGSPFTATPEQISRQFQAALLRVLTWHQYQQFQLLEGAAPLDSSGQILLTVEQE